jgi:DNA-binding protein YbaB
MCFHPLRGLTALAVLALPGLLTAEDLTIVQKVTRDQNPPVVMTSYVSADKIRMASGDGNEVLAEAGGKFTVIDHKKKEYTVITTQDLDAMATQMEARMKEMDEKMKNMPPEVRQKMAGMMGGAAAAVDVQKGAGGRTIAGYHCDNWVMSIGTMSRTEQCLSTELALPAQAWDGYQAFATKLRASMGAMAKGMEAMQEKMKQMKGLPLASTTTVSVMGHNSTSSTEVTEIKKGPIPASAWQLPAGYKQGESPLAAMGKRK